MALSCSRIWARTWYRLPLPDMMQGEGRVEGIGFSRASRFQSVDNGPSVVGSVFRPSGACESWVASDRGTGLLRTPINAWIGMVPRVNNRCARSGPRGAAHDHRMKFQRSSPCNLSGSPGQWSGKCCGRY